jgi:hypothetical protein
MKKIFLIGSLFIIISAALISCQDPSPADKLLRGTHLLVPFPQKRYFVFENIEDSMTTPRTVVMFQWKGNDGKVHPCSILYREVYAQYPKKQQAPTVRFRWSRYDGSEQKINTDTIVKNCVETAFIEIPEKDWPVRSARQYRNADHITK